LIYSNYIGFNAKDFQTGMSYLTDQIGQKVFGENITIKDEVENENTIPFFFDEEGYKRTAF
jgi:predicted Zn-dependent protease